MKAFCFLLSISFLLLSCATDPGAAPLTASPAVRQLPAEEAIYDVEWMQRYEGAARRGGARVYWVNKPMRDRAE